MSTPATNPLYQFRRPAWEREKTGETHAFTPRGSVENDTGVLTIYPGDFTYEPDKTLEIEFGLWEDNDSQESFKSYLNMTTREGFNVAQAKDFEVSDRLKLVWKGDESGRLTMGGRSKVTMVLMWRSGDRSDEAFKRRTKVSDQVQQSVEERKDALQNKLDSLGAEVTMSLEDDDGTDNMTTTPQRRRRGR